MLQCCSSFSVHATDPAFHFVLSESPSPCSFQFVPENPPRSKLDLPEDDLSATSPVGIASSCSVRSGLIYSYSSSSTSPLLKGFPPLLTSASPNLQATPIMADSNTEHSQQNGINGIHNHEERNAWSSPGPAAFDFRSMLFLSTAHPLKHFHDRHRPTN